MGARSPLRPSADRDHPPGISYEYKDSILQATITIPIRFQLHVAASLDTLRPPQQHSEVTAIGHA